MRIPATSIFNHCSMCESDEGLPEGFPIPLVSIICKALKRRNQFGNAQEGDSYNFFEVETWMSGLEDLESCGVLSATP
jgi:hypothetical protein